MLARSIAILIRCPFCELTKS
uniref:Uncharacterized protein n=1 Tax=Arundo donax TaxID=35708 RepID=A0A0A8Y8G9_ARUDO